MYDLLLDGSSSCWLEADQSSGRAYNTESCDTHHITQSSVIFYSSDLAGGFKFGQETAMYTTWNVLMIKKFALNVLAAVVS